MEVVPTVGCEECARRGDALRGDMVSELSVLCAVVHVVASLMLATDTRDLLIYQQAMGLACVTPKPVPLFVCCRMGWHSDGDGVVGSDRRGLRCRDVGGMRAEDGR